MTSYASTSAKKTTHSGFVWTLSDIWQMTKRNLIHYTRKRQLLAFSIIQPIMFTVLFVYVFGGAIQTPGFDYVNFLLPGIMIQAMMFGSIQTAVGLADDMTKGLIDRFLSLPMSRSAVLAGRTMADSVRNIFVIGIMLGIGYAIGFRILTDFGLALAGVGLMLLFSFSIMWIMATVGMVTKNAETSQLFGMIVLFPLVFASSAFVPVATMPGWLQGWAEISPVTVTVNAVRGLLITGVYTPWLWQSLMWIGGILVVFFPLAVNRYRRVV